MFRVKNKRSLHFQQENKYPEINNLGIQTCDSGSRLKSMREVIVKYQKIQSGNIHIIPQLLNGLIAGGKLVSWGEGGGATVPCVLSSSRLVSWWTSISELRSWGEVGRATGSCISSSSWLFLRRTRLESVLKEKRQPTIWSIRRAVLGKWQIDIYPPAT